MTTGLLPCQTIDYPFTANNRLLVSRTADTNETTLLVEDIAMEELCTPE